MKWLALPSTVSTKVVSNREWQKSQDQHPCHRWKPTWVTSVFLIHSSHDKFLLWRTQRSVVKFSHHVCGFTEEKSYITSMTLLCTPEHQARLLPMFFQSKRANYELRYACVIWLLFLIKPIYLNGVWLNVDLRTDTIATHGHQLWEIMCLLISN